MQCLALSFRSNMEYQTRNGGSRLRWRQQFALGMHIHEFLVHLGTQITALALFE